MIPGHGVTVTVTHVANGWLVACTQCGNVARREMQHDAQTKAERHADEHLLLGQPAEVSA